MRGAINMERREFVGGKWQRLIDVRDFIQKNYTLYEGDASFLSGPTEKTQKVWAKCLELLAEELKKAFLTWKQKRFPVFAILPPDILIKRMKLLLVFRQMPPLKEW